MTPDATVRISRVPMPERIARLPRDPRGYPISWNVLRRTTGEPVFTANDDRRYWEALRRELCPICGERLGKWKWFIGGPLSAFDPNGWYFDLPMHHECMQYAAQVCPYLAMPRYLGRVDVPDTRNLPSPVLLDNTQIPDRPELFVAPASNRVEITKRSETMLVLPYLRPMRPYLGIEFWQHGKQLDPVVGLTMATTAAKAATLVKELIKEQPHEDS